MRIHLSDISSSEGKCIQQSVPFEMDRISFQAGTYPVLAKKPVELCICLLYTSPSPRDRG